MEVNLVDLWLRKDPVRWMAGVLAGIFAGLVGLAVAMVFAQASGMDPWFPVKLMGTPILGPAATEYGMNLTSILAGLFFFELVAAFWGFVFAHFVPSNALKTTLPMGLAWAAFSWVFLWNLFFNSIRTIRYANVPPSAAMPVCVAYGLALSSVILFDAILGGSQVAKVARKKR